MDLVVERLIAASPEALWAMVSDVTRVGEWSPEAERCRWLGGAGGPSVGARFKGFNRNGSKKWSTTNTVVACEPGRRFAFETTVGPFKVSRWDYAFEADGGACRVTETWSDRRGWLVTALGGPASGVKDRGAHNRGTMEATLERLAAAAEAG